MVLLSIIKNIRWQDLLDIFVLTVIFYRLFLMIRGTRTSQTLIGFALVAFIYYLTSTFQLHGLSLLLTHLFNSLVVVVVVLFQTEFRNTLAKLGTQTLFHDLKKPKTSKLLDNVWEAAELFSRTKVGALIVFEKEIGLGGYTSSGTRLDAEVSPHLMAAIFNTKAPLHDGAIIVDKMGRLMYAGCILPLTSRLDLSPKMGTRHRAALGLSGETDAVILVVSEENRKISLAYQGDFLPEQGEALKEKLKELLPRFA